MYGTNKSSVEGFGGSTPNLGDANTTQDSAQSVTVPKKSKSGIVFGNSNNPGHNIEGKWELAGWLTRYVSECVISVANMDDVTLARPHTCWQHINI